MGVCASDQNCDAVVDVQNGEPGSAVRARRIGAEAIEFVDGTIKSVDYVDICIECSGLPGREVSEFDHCEQPDEETHG